MRPSAVFFDFDGILVDTEWAIYQAWLETFRSHGQDLPLSLYTRCIGSDFDAWSPKTYLEDLTQLGFDWLNMDADRQIVIRSALEKEGAIDGVVDLLGEIRENGIPVAVVSSSSHNWVDGWLEKLDLGGFFNEIVCKGDAPRIKPAPDLYLEAASRMGVPAGECLVIEDSLNGLLSAHAAAMKVWIVPNRVTAALDFRQADRVVGDFKELREALFRP
jgi:HAD superfamily hydrolase (TIGR01509 family)